MTYSKKRRSLPTGRLEKSGRRARRRAARRFRPIRYEPLEARQLLSGLWIAQIDGLPDDSDAERIAAAEQLFHVAGLSDDQVQAIAVVDPRESILLKTPATISLPNLVSELHLVAGFVDAGEYDPGNPPHDDDESEGQPENPQASDVGGGSDAPSDPGQPPPPDNPSGVTHATGGNLFIDSLGSYEPTVAINPTQPQNVAVAQFNKVRLSLDGGATFPILCPAPLFAGQTDFAGDPSLTFDAQGRLFFTYLSYPGTNNHLWNVAILQINPSTGAIAGGPYFVANGSLDKEWLAADHNPSSPFANNLYAVWGNDGFDPNAPVFFARSTDHGVSWSTPVQLSGQGQGFTFGGEVDVGPNGDVWVAWHTHTGQNTTVANQGEIRMRRSTDGGLTFGSEDIIPFPAGTADATSNGNAPRISGLKSILIGTTQPRILLDPVRPNTVYVVTVDDPDNLYTPTGDPSDIVIAKSIDNGLNWTRSTLSHGPAGTIQIMPAAAIDADGNITATWYDNRRGQRNSSGDFMLDVYASTSTDGGQTFSNDIRINDAAFDPDLGAEDHDPPYGNLRIGEYNGVAAAGGAGYAVWTGNAGTNQQIIFDKYSLGFQVAGVTPTQNSMVTSPPTDIVVQLTESALASSVDTSDLSMNCLSPISCLHPDSVTVNAAGDTLTFHFDSSPVTAEGLQMMMIPAGAIMRLSDSAPLAAYSGSFHYDPQPLTVASTGPPAGGVIYAPDNRSAIFDIDFNFNEPVLPAECDPIDAGMEQCVVNAGLQISGIGSPNGFTADLLNDNKTVRFSVYVTQEGTLTATLAAGTLVDVNGNPNLPFTATYQVDIGAYLPPASVSPRYPLGSLVYDPQGPGVINYAGDTDDFQITADAGQQISAYIHADSGTLQPTVQLVDVAGNVLGSAAASAVGMPAVLQPIRVASGGTYRVRVGGAAGTTGNYTAQMLLNAAFEAADFGIGDDSTLAGAQDLDAVFSTLSTAQSSATRAAVLGRINPDTLTVDASDSGWWNVLGNHTATNKNYFVGFSGGLTYRDYFVFDLSSVRQRVKTARLTLSNPPTSYISSDSTETYSLFDVSTPLPALEATDSGQSAIFTDLRTGVEYGSRDFSAADNTQLTSLDLNAAAVSQINTNFDGHFAFGGAITTLNGGDNQLIFAGTDSGEPDTKQLQLTLTNQDYYSITLAAGQHVTIGVKSATGSGITIALLDASGKTLATGVNAANVDQAINDFAAPAAGRYFIQLTGSTTTVYNLVVTRDAVFDVEPNNSPTTAQPLDGVNGVVGYYAPGTVVPAGLTNTEGDFRNSYPFNLGNTSVTSMRYQQVYRADDFSDLGTITAIRFRREAQFAGFSKGGIDVGIFLGYAKLPFEQTSATFADNIGDGRTSVYDSSTDGLLTLTSLGIGTPNPFDIVINLKRPFFYDPTKGDLLLDIFMRNAPKTTFFDATTFSQQQTYSELHSTGRVYAENGVNALTGTLATSGLVTRFDMAPADDWYSLNVTDTASSLRLETSTPADGTFQFSNTLSPHIELYSTTALVASGIPTADGRNESIQYQPPATGQYLVRVISKNSTQGEYFLSKNFSPVLRDLAVSPISEGDAAILTGTISDEDTEDTHAVTISWGDGSQPTTLSLDRGITAFTAQHVYPDNPGGSDHYTIAVAGDDSHNTVAVATADVVVTNVPPPLTDFSINGSRGPGETATLIADFHDPGTADTHTLLIGWGPTEEPAMVTTAGPNPPGTSLVYLGNGSWQLTASHQYSDQAPPTSSIQNALSLSITDNAGGTTDARLLNTLEDAPLTSTLTASGFDNPQFTVVTDVSHGTLALDSATGALLYQPAKDWSGFDSFTATISGSNGGSTTQTVYLSVQPVNDPPTLDPIGAPALVADINPGAPSSSIGPIVDVNGIAFFAADDGVHGVELWKSDGTAAGTMLVKDIVTGSASSNPTDLTAVNSSLFFTIGGQLWISDGTTDGTKLVSDSPDAPAAAAELTNVGGTLFFSAIHGHGHQLWKSNGTAAGTVAIKDIGPDEDLPFDRHQLFFTNVNGELFFVTMVDEIKHYDSFTDWETGKPVVFLSSETPVYSLWKSDGTGAGTVKVRDLKLGFDPREFAPDQEPGLTAEVNGDLCFIDYGTAFDDQMELWKTDGTEQGTVKLADLGVNGPMTGKLTNIDGVVYFNIWYDSLWQSDGTAAGTHKIDDAPFVLDFAPLNGKVLLYGYVSDDGYAIFDPSTGTVDTHVDSTSKLYLTGIDVSGKLFFTRDDGIHGTELWATGIGAFDILEDARTLSIYLTGISAGPGESQTLTITATSDNPALIPNPTIDYTSPNSTGTLSFQPLPDQFGTATITVTIKDDGGTANGGIDIFTRTFTVNVTPVNDPPSFDHRSDRYSAYDENLNTHGPAIEQVVLNWATKISVGPANESDQQPSWEISNDNHALFTADGQPALDAARNLTYTPMPNAHGTAHVTVILHDTGEGTNTSAPVTFDIEIDKKHRLHNAAESGNRTGLDVSGSTTAQPDGFIAANDVLAVINYISAHPGSDHIPDDAKFGPPYVDVNGDDVVAADDVIQIINWINAHPSQSEAEDTSGATVTDSAIDDQSINAATDTTPRMTSADLISLLAADAATAAIKRRRSSF
jgi:ELWxxDGT repeat protein